MGNEKKSNFFFHLTFLLLFKKEKDIEKNLTFLAVLSSVSITQLISNMYYKMNWNILKLKWIDMELHTTTFFLKSNVFATFQKRKGYWKKYSVFLKFNVYLTFYYFKKNPDTSLAQMHLIILRKVFWLSAFKNKFSLRPFYSEISYLFEFL